jgi:beta-1,4-mannosyltransferase
LELKNPNVQQISKRAAYIYPVTARNFTGIHNPYMDNFIDSTGRFINYLNKDHASNKGILDLFGYLDKIDLLFLNWIEDLPEKKGGIMQALIFLTVLRLKRFSRIKVVWTLHNKFSHSPNNLFLKKLLFTSMLKRSDLIITHSEEGISFAESFQAGISSKMFYFPHPIVPFKAPLQDPGKKYDILIWGTLAPYKAIDVFLQYLSEKNAIEKYRILIAGKAVSPEFEMKLKSYENGNISIINKFVTSDELALMIRQSRITLFTYSGNSVLSSGALIDSVSHGATVLGPAVGAFAELGREGIIRTYESLDELLVLLEQLDQFDNSDLPLKITEFIRSHSWPEFAKALANKMEQLYKISGLP